MAKKKRSSKASSKSSSSKSKPAILSLSKVASKRSAKARVGKKTHRGKKVVRKTASHSPVKGRKY